MQSILTQYYNINNNIIILNFENLCCFAYTMVLTICIFFAILKKIQQQFRIVVKNQTGNGGLNLQGGNNQITTLIMKIQNIEFLYLFFSKMSCIGKQIEIWFVKQKREKVYLKKQKKENIQLQLTNDYCNWQGYLILLMQILH
eukprot:TRINITY_DN36711_c1_g1_i4.p4 TRINITY_DN36711_c1_g1~~TRINITY_DN36711_c1_g1_i4.p4  ORF type:complete len:143 (-),score=1.20 TRINITY_DN36711_c1_g1_i4:230-658(-)